MLLDLVCFENSAFLHVSHGPSQDVHTHGLTSVLGPILAVLCLQSLGMGAAELGDQLRCIQPRIVADGGGNGQQGFGVRFHGQGSFARSSLGLAFHIQGHLHLWASTSTHHAGIFHGSFQHAQRIVERPLRFVKYVTGRSAQHNGAGFTQRHSGEPHHGLLSHGDLFHQVAGSQAHLDLLLGTKVRGYLSPSDQRQAFDAVKVGVFYGHDPCICEDLFWIVVDELSIDKAVGTGVQYGLAFVLHLCFLGGFQVAHLFQAFRPDSCTVELELVGVHGGVGDQYFGVFHPFGLSDPRFFVQQESFVQERILQATSRHLDDLYGVQLSFSFQSQDSLNGQLREVDLFLGENFGRQRGARELEEVLAEPLFVLCMIDCQHFQGFQGRLACRTIPCHHGHGMELLFKEEGFGVFEQLAREHDDGSSTVSHFVVLSFGDVHEKLGGWIVHVHGLEDGGSVVGDL
mmetsp:Transcript_4247/g.27088  ORF Transcript_4247/g.27088 Transcript_4247/m.27088 type:complete len:458 (-) Transcript_4247:267-1640(-)